MEEVVAVVVHPVEEAAAVAEVPVEEVLALAVDEVLLEEDVEAQEEAPK